MKKNPFFKIAAIASAALLATAFVAYRGGAFDLWGESKKPDEKARSPRGAHDKDGQYFMSGSKSDWGLIPIPSSEVPRSTPTETVGVPAEPQIIMGGSKTLFIPGGILTEPTAPSEVTNTIIWGYKWPPVFPKPAYQKSPDKPPTIIYGPKSAPVFPEK